MTYDGTKTTYDKAKMTYDGKISDDFAKVRIRNI